MIRGFPTGLLSSILCNQDEGPLRPRIPQVDNFIEDGEIHCEKCGATYNISHGILVMLDNRDSMNEISSYEMRTRDHAAAKDSIENRASNDAVFDAMEMPATIGKLKRVEGLSLLELGCGTGKYTKVLGRSADSLLAVDFSMKSLQVNANSLQPCDNVGLLCADVARLKLRPGSFDSALSTLYSNLPTPAIRLTSTRAVKTALKSGGRYVLSAHHRDIREVLRRTASSGTYDNGIFYRSFTAGSLKRELRRCFSEIRTVTICIWIPYLSRAGRTRAFVSRVSERIPFVNRMGSIILALCVKN